MINKKGRWPDSWSALHLIPFCWADSECSFPSLSPHNCGAGILQHRKQNQSLCQAERGVKSLPCGSPFLALGPYE